MMTFSLDRNKQQPLYHQLKTHLIRQIENGILKPGDRLPASRDLAKELGVGRISVLTAYEELKDEDYLTAQVGRGTFVAGIPPIRNGGFALAGAGSDRQGSLHQLLGQASRPDVINFAQGTLPKSFLPVEKIQEILNKVLERDGAAAITYEAPEGYWPLREEIALLAGDQGITVRPDEVLVTGGCQQALDLVIQSLLNPSDVILTGCPTYPGILTIAQTRGITPIGVDIDEDGMQTDQLESLIVEHRPRLIYTAPTYHNPTGSVMSIHRRRHLLEIAGRYHIPVLEDGVYESLHFSGNQPPPPLKALDQEDLVIYANSFSKTILPGIRIGYLLTGDRLYERISRVKQTADICSPSLNQRVVHWLIESGEMKRYIRKLRSECHPRREAMAAALINNLPEAKWKMPSGGLYLWVNLPKDGPSVLELYTHAVRAGVGFGIGPMFHVGNYGDYAMRLNMISYPPETIREGIKILAETYRLLKGDYQSGQTFTNQQPLHI